MNVTNWLWGFLFFLEGMHERKWSQQCCQRAVKLISSFFQLFPLFFWNDASAFSQRLYLFFLSLFCRDQFARSDVQRAGSDQTVQRSVCATTGANATPKVDSASVLKVSPEAGVHVELPCILCMLRDDFSPMTNVGRKHSSGGQPGESGNTR